MLKCFKIPKARGLPCKSFIHIIELDYNLKQILSYLTSLNNLDLFVSSKVCWKFKYNDREKEALDFILFSTVSDTERIQVLFNSRFVRRSDLIYYIGNLYSTLKESFTNESLRFDINNILKNNQQLKLTLLDVYPKLKSFKDKLINHYINFIVKKLMLRRKGEKNPNLLKTDAYSVLLDMLDDYNYKKSKVPFNNYLDFFIRNRKNKIIKEALWNLPEGSIVPIDESYSNTPIVDMTKQSKYESEALQLALYDIPFLYKNIIYLKHSIIDPLSIEEEQLLLTIGERHG